ncbi:MAG: porphobilinogen synthase [Dehalococcoidia bacterium]|nr:porphobilinogen synthase [Dehalococcoidia bacterium]
MSSFPENRMRRLRATPALRRLVQETQLSVSDLIYPMFVAEDVDERREIEPMPGIFQHSLDSLKSEVEAVAGLGIPAVLVFGIPSHKDEVGSQGYAPNGITQQAIRAIKRVQPELAVIGDVCMCEYTSHGHCGILLDDGTVDNDQTLELLAKTAVSQADAGVDIVAPSAMMDGQVGAIRDALDDNDHENVPIMAYSAKYASSFYGPFRTAAESAPQMGDRKGYQMDPPNVNEAMREIEQDIFEGADIVMVKPALAYLDVIAKAKQRFDTPLAAYNVSGEYSMVKAAGINGWIDERRIVMEILTGIKRAGADMIMSYHAKDVAGWLAEER